MITPELVNYVKHQLQSGVQPQEIYQVLQAKGWQESDINQALFEAGSQTPNIQAQPLSSTGKPSFFASNHKKSFWLFGLISCFVIVLIVSAFIIGPIIVISAFSIEP